MNYNEKIIIALDFGSLDEVKNFISQFSSQGEEKYQLNFVKVGMELFYAEGPEIVKYLKGEGLKVFLDLKIHDIPNTAKGAASSIASLGADIINVHASGTIKMMQAAREGIEEATSLKPLIIGVTQLTSTDEATLNNELAISGSIENSVLNLAKNTKKAGLNGIVCSPLEAKKIKEELGEDFLTVCPGIRPKVDGDFQNTQDQKRIMSPEEAFNNGCDYIVIGRAITQAKDPAAALENIIRKIEQQLLLN